MRKLARILFAMGPDGFLTLVALVGIGLLGTTHGGRFAMVVDGIAPLVVLGGLLALTAVAKLPLLLSGRPDDRRLFFRRQRVAIRAWAPFVLLYVCYRALRGTMVLLVSGGVEAKLKALDEAILGVSPSWWMERFASPWLTEVMAFAYALMFVMPIVIMILLYTRDRLPDFREVALAVLAAFYVGFIGYLLVPAQSPRVVFPYATQLHGAFGLYEATTVAWDRVEQMKFDAFPSLHTAISSIALFHAWWFGSALSRRRPRLLFWIYLPAVVCLQISTLYLRQHYFVDLVGGWVLAGLSVWLAPRLAASWDAICAWLAGAAEKARPAPRSRAVIVPARRALRPARGSQPVMTLRQSLRLR